MPEHLIHFYVDRIYFKKVYWRVHRDMDSAYPYFGSRHRIFWHDSVSACGIAANDYPGDENAVTSALLHIETDRLCSANPFLHNQLWLLAKEDVKRRKRAKKQKTKRKKKQKREGRRSTPKEFMDVEEFLGKILEIKRLRNEIMS
jgi:hypothetical protein